MPAQICTQQHHHLKAPIEVLICAGGRALHRGEEYLLSLHRMTTNWVMRTNAASCTTGLLGARDFAQQRREYVASSLAGERQGMPVREVGMTAMQWCKTKQEV